MAMAEQKDLDFPVILKYLISVKSTSGVHEWNSIGNTV